MAPRVSSADLALVLVGAGVAVALSAALVGRTATPALLALAGLGVALALMLAGRRGATAGRYGAFALRVALSLALLGGGMVLLRAPLPLAQALGAAWVAGGAALALGFLTPWAALYASLAFPLIVPAGFYVPAGLALAALGLALTDDDLLSVDKLLRGRGGLFPTFRREVVLEPLGKDLGKTL